MPKHCPACNRVKGKNHICDLVQLSDGRSVHISRLEPGGDLRDEIGEDLQIVSRSFTHEMREQIKKGYLDVS